MRIELIYAHDCPRATSTRAMLRRCLNRVGMHVPVEETLEEDHPSPTVLVDGIDVMGEPAALVRSCRLDVPTEDRIMAILQAPAGHGLRTRSSEEDKPARP